MSTTIVYLIGWAIFVVLLVAAIVTGLLLGQHRR